MFKYSLDNKRYHTLNYYFKNKFHTKVSKVSLNADFSCPNRDGSKSVGGCIFCSDLGSGDFAGDVKLDLQSQFEQVSMLQRKKWPDAKLVAYFQAYSNTYAPVEKLRSYYELVLGFKDVVGLHIATRPDCISDETYQLLAQLNQETDLWIELGLQSSNDDTALYLNRQHDYECFKQCVLKLRSLNIKVCVHIINGILIESRDDMIKTIQDLSQLGIDGIKIHMLHIMKNTQLEKMYLLNPQPLLTRDEYIEIVARQLRYLNPKTVVFRLTGDASLDDLIEPRWIEKKVTILNDIDKYMLEHNYYQGDLYQQDVL